MARKINGPILPGERKLLGAPVTVKPRWTKGGPSPNPLGRRPGAKNKLGEQFIYDLYAKWQEKGLEVIDHVIATKPEVFLRVVACIIPKELRVDVENKADEAQLDAVIAAVKAEVDRRAKERATEQISFSSAVLADAVADDDDEIIQ